MTLAKLYRLLDAFSVGPLPHPIFGDELNANPSEGMQISSLEFRSRDRRRAFRLGGISSAITWTICVVAAPEHPSAVVHRVFFDRFDFASLSALPQVGCCLIDKVQLDFVRSAWRHKAVYRRI
jgi:hypothetical protein